MHITKLKLENFRGFAELELELDKELNVFIGENGSGKSSVLDAIRMLLSSYVHLLTYAAVPKINISETDIHLNKSTSSLSITVTTVENSQLYWGQYLYDVIEESTGIYKRITPNQSILLNSKDIQNQNKQNSNIFIHYSVNRSVIKTPLGIKNQHYFTELDAYEDCLSRESNFPSFFLWFRLREDLELETKQDDITHSDLQLNAVRDAIAEILPEYTKPRIRRNPPRMEITKELNGTKEILRIDQLSDGEKCMIAMVGDIARRLAIANPNLEDPLQGNGIVMIDEIELHLHPRWQQVILSRLKKTFLNVQFIITTHSPLVINNIKDDDALFVLKPTPEGITHTRHKGVYGKDIIRIIEDVMGMETTRPSKIQKALDELFADLDQQKLNDAEEKLKKLEETLGRDPDLTRARTWLRRLRYFAEKK